MYTRNKIFYNPNWKSWLEKKNLINGETKT